MSAVMQSDPGPMARLAQVCADAGSMGVIAQRVAGGETLRAICKAWEVPHGGMLAWLMGDDARWGTYRNALVAAGFAESDAALEIADGAPRQAEDSQGKPMVDEAGKPVMIDADPARDKLRVDIRRWRATKNSPEFFGERVEVAHRTLPSEEALMGQLDALISGSPWLIDKLLERRARLALPVNDVPAASALTEK